MVVCHRKQRLQNFRIRKGMFDKTQCRFFIQFKVLFQQPVDTVAFDIRVRTYDNAVIIRYTPPYFGNGLLLSLIGNRFDLPGIRNHRVNDSPPAFIFPFFVICRHVIRTDMSGKRHKINLSDFFDHFIFMIFITSLHISHKARFLCNK